MKKGLGNIIFGGLLLVVPAVVFIASVIATFSEVESERNQFLVPGSIEIKIDEPGKYYLWHDFVGIYDGRTFNLPKEIPHGVEIKIFGADDELLSFSESLYMNVNSGNHSKGSIGYVEVEEAGLVKISVSGNFDDRIFSFSKSSFGKIFGTIFGGIVLVGATTLLGLIMLIVGIVNYSKKENQREII